MTIRTLAITLISLALSAQAFAADTHSNSTIRTKPIKGTVALTFDDGPSPIYTPQILAILKKNIFTQLFSWLAPTPKNIRKLQMVQADGHAIASHTLTHPKLTHLSDAGLRHEVLTTQTILTKITGTPPACLRPPFGMANAHVREFIRAQGIVPVPWGGTHLIMKNRCR